MNVELDLIERGTIRKALSLYYSHFNREYSEECAKADGIPYVKNTALIEMSRTETVHRKFDALPRDTD
jgi:hypothetical protein